MSYKSESGVILIISLFIMFRVYREDIEARSKSNASKVSLTVASLYPKDPNPCGAARMNGAEIAEILVDDCNDMISVLG